jgi:hypothetical protein
MTRKGGLILIAFRVCASSMLNALPKHLPNSDLRVAIF